MVWLLALALQVFTAIGSVCGVETTQTIWDVDKVVNTTILPDNAEFSVVARSAIECVLTAMTNNKSVATLDELSQRCTVYSTNKDVRLLYIDVIRQGLQNGESVTAGINPSPISEIEVGGINQNLETCADIDLTRSSGVYRITPVPEDSFDVYCDMDSGQGPWTVIQNRQSNEVDFFRNWDQYKNGFGNLLGNFWLGNDHIFSLTRTPCILRVQVESLNGTLGYAEYSEFQISDELANYKISVSGFSGNISDALRNTNRQLFSTIDRDNDLDDIKQCAETRHGAWWFRKCTNANLNGLYDYDPSNLKTSMFWRNFFGENMYVPMKTSKMMLKKP